MAELADMVRVWVEEVINLLGYPGVFLVMLLENVFPPIPSEVVMPFAGFAAARGQFDFVGVVIAGTLGSLAGALILYYVGMFAGEPVIRLFTRRYGKFWGVSESDFDRSLAFFYRHGYVVVLACRVIPLIRSLISIPAGMSRMPLIPFILLTTIGSAVWSGLLAYFGLLLGENWEQVLDFMDRYEKIMLAAMAVALLAFLYRWYRVKRGRDVERTSVAE